MDGLEAKINKILSDPEALGSVLEMAKSLTGSDLGAALENAAPAPEEKAPSNALAEVGGIGDLLGGMDPATIGKLMGLMGEYSKGDDGRAHLLTALKPYIREERQGKMDRAVQIMKLARIARLALGSFGGDGDI